MADQSGATGSSRNPLVGILVFVLIVGALWGFNRWRFQSRVTSDCAKEMGTGDEFCACLGKEMTGEMNPLGFVPLVGRMFRPDDAKAMGMANAAMTACLSNSN